MRSKMRGIALAVGTLAFAAPRFAAAQLNGGNVLVTWSLEGAPAVGVANITFPMTINRPSAHQFGIYCAAEYGFTNAADIGYTGLQPLVNNSGQERLHAAFSSFIAGTTSSDPNCSNGADGGPGVSCATEFDAVYGHTYNLQVVKTGADTWSGTAIDVVTGQSSHVGTYTLPSGSGNIQGSQVGFVESFLSNTPSCPEMPLIDVFFGGPTSTDAGGLQGQMRSSHEYNGDCLGKSNYSAMNEGDGVHVLHGFIGSGLMNDAGAGGAGGVAGSGGTMSENGGAGGGGNASIGGGSGTGGSAAGGTSGGAGAAGASGSAGVAQSAGVGGASSNLPASGAGGSGSLPNADAGCGCHLGAEGETNLLPRLLLAALLGLARARRRRDPTWCASLTAPVG